MVAKGLLRERRTLLHSFWPGLRSLLWLKQMICLRSGSLLTLTQQTGPR
jgi:hypothetical protein